MIYVDVMTNPSEGITMNNQKRWLDENSFSDYKHIKTATTIGFSPQQYNRWRFSNEEDAFAFKLFWC